MNVLTAFKFLEKEIAAKKPSAVNQAILFAVMQVLNRKFWKGAAEPKEIRDILGSDIRTVQNGVIKLTELGILKKHRNGVTFNVGREERPVDSGREEVKRGVKPAGRSLADFATSSEK